MGAQPIPKGDRSDVNESIEIWCCKIVATLLGSNELLNSGYSVVVQAISSVVEMGVQILRLDDVGRKWNPCEIRSVHRLLKQSRETYRL
jgi:hypothetical protein